MAGPARLGISLVVGLAGLAGGVYLQLVAAKPRASGGAAAAAQAIVKDLTQAVLIAETRARPLAVMESVRSGIGTDDVTLQNVIRGDTTITIAPNEGVAFLRHSEGRDEILFIQPESARPLAPRLIKAGTQVVGGSPNLEFWVTVPVQPKYKAPPDFLGWLAVRGVVDLHESIARLREEGARAELVGLGDPIPLSDIAISGKVEESGVLIPASSGLTGARIALHVPVQEPPVTGWLLGGLGLVALASLLIPSGHKRSVASDSSAASGGDLGSAQTELAHAVSSPMMIGRYHLLRKVASGGMADLFLAEVKGAAKFAKRIAIKRMHAHLAQQAQLREYFLDEARVVAQLSHPNLAQIFELGKDENGSFFIAMEFIEGCDLATLIEQLRGDDVVMPLRAALTIGIAIAEGLYYAHTAMDADRKPLQIVHRDIKPSNVLLSKDGAVKIADFGIAKASSQVHVTEIGSVAGTVAYMAPEQRTAQSVDARADLFALGAILYEMVTGREVDMDLAKLAPRGMDKWPHLDPPSAARPGLPAALDTILFRALSYEPSARQADCRVLARDLEAVLIAAGHVPSTSYLAEWLAQVGAGRGAAQTAESA